MSGNASVSRVANPAPASVTCYLCEQPIGDTVYVAPVRVRGWSFVTALPLCAGCFGNRRVIYQTTCVVCGRGIVGGDKGQVKGSDWYYLSGPPRTYCAWPCQREAANERRRTNPALARPERPCAWCGTVFTPSRSDARYCSGRCRVAAHRAR